MSLTINYIKTLLPRRKRFVVTDANGLCLEVLPSGKRSWFYRYRFKGRQEKIVFGRYPEMSLKSARQQRDKFAAQLISGESPAVQKKLSKLALSKDSTLREFSVRYYKEVVVRTRKDPRNMRRYLDNEVLPILGSKRIAEVTTGDVRSLVFRKRDNG